MWEWNRFATSAKKGVNIDKAAKFLVEDILQNHKEHSQNVKTVDPDVVDIRAKPAGGKEEKNEDCGC